MKMHKEEREIVVWRILCERERVVVMGFRRAHDTRAWGCHVGTYICKDFFLLAGRSKLPPYIYEGY